MTVNTFRVTILGYAPDGTDAKGNVRHLVRWRTVKGEECQAHTRGPLTESLHGVATGTIVHLSCDGRGTITAIRKA